MNLKAQLLSIFLICLSFSGFSQVGEIMMEYNQHSNDGSSVKQVFTWNTKTGESATYYYENRQWIKSEVSIPSQPLSNPSSEIGEIMMDYNQYLNDKGNLLKQVFVWNTKTAESARYYYKGGQWKKSDATIPSQPLSEASTQIGEIMMDYNQYSNDNGKSMKQVFVWNTITGESARYYYKGGEWKKTSASLPTNPME